MKNRVIFAFNPDLRFLRTIAEPEGDMDILISFHYLQGKKQDKMVRGWGEFTKKYNRWLYIDSGVFSIRKQYGVLDYGRWKDLTPDMKDHVRLNSDQQQEVIEFTDRYIDFLKTNYDYYDWAFEMDCDEFTSIDFANSLYNRMKEVIGPHKIIRVWHSSRSFDDWVKWCKDPEMEYLGIEGLTVHSRNADFYNKFIDLAHKHGKKVHVLAITTKEFLRDTSVDSVDSSTWVNGGRFASMIIPEVGHVIFSEQTDLTKDTSAVRMHYSLLNDYDMQKALDWFKECGFTLEDVLKDKTEGANIRCRINIQYFKKYVGSIQPLPYRKGELF